jgi:hypothetical protein
MKAIARYRNGIVYLTTGMIAHGSRDQLAMIIAHEIIHGTFAPACKAIGAIHFKAGRLARARDYLKRVL